MTRTFTAVLFAFTLTHTAFAVAQYSNRIVTDNIVTVDQLTQRIFYTGVIGVKNDGGALYQSDIESVGNASGQINEFFETGTVLKPQKLSTKQINDGVSSSSSLWKTNPTINKDISGDLDVNNVDEAISTHKGARVFISSYKNAVSGASEITKPRLKKRPVSKKSDQGRKFVLGVHSKKSALDVDTTAVSHYFTSDQLETNIELDEPELNEPDIPANPVKNNWSLKDSRLNIYLDIPKMNPWEND